MLLKNVVDFLDFAIPVCLCVHNRKCADPAYGFACVAHLPQKPGYYTKEGEYVFVKEMIPEFVVPDLTGFKVFDTVLIHKSFLFQNPDRHLSNLPANDEKCINNCRCCICQWNRPFSSVTSTSFVSLLST